jgi:hypothetical protein
MRSFRWLLNWAVQDLFTNNGDVIPVWSLSRHIGTCTISIEENQIVGNFELTEDLNNQDYILYVATIADRGGQMWLDGIRIVPPDRLGGRHARRVGEM